MQNNFNKEAEARKILIIDDEGDTCFLLSNVLKGRNVEIEQVNTLSQAAVFIREEQPSLIFLDNKLPDGLGINELESLKSDYPETRIIVITGSGNSSDKRKAFDRGADGFLTKPFTSEQVLNLVDEVNRESIVHTDH